jgi:hypothetical protein
MSGILLPTGDVVLVGTRILICILVDQAIGARLERFFVLRSRGAHVRSPFESANVTSRASFLLGDRPRGSSVQMGQS